MHSFIEYEVKPGENVPEGLPHLKLEVLSRLWQGMSMDLKYPDEEVRTLVGWGGPGAGSPVELQVFWTRHEPGGPAVCLAIGGDAGVRDLGPPGGTEFPKGMAFLALAESMIPADVLEVIGPAPSTEEVLLLT